MSRAQHSASLAEKRATGVTGIDDGLPWHYLGRLLKKHTSAERLQFVWWWKERFMKPSLIDYLATQPDRGRSVAYTYEAVARALGEYPMRKPFNLLGFIEADNFAMAYVPKPNPIHGFDFIKDPLSHYTDRAKRSDVVSDFVLNAEYQHEKHMRQFYSEPLVIRFNLHRSAGAIAKKIEELVKALQKEAKISVRQKNNETHAYFNFESWDLRRWKEDKVDELKIHEDLKIKIRTDVTQVAKTRITKARNYAREAIKNRTDFDWDKSHYYNLYDDRPMMVNPYW